MAISASIQALLAGEQVAGSRLNSKLLDELLAEGLLLVVSRGSRKSYRARDAEALKRFLVDKDESFRIIEANASDSRATMAAETGNSKLVMVRSCPGFPVNSYEKTVGGKSAGREFSFCLGLGEVYNSGRCSSDWYREYGKFQNDSQAADTL